MTIHCEKVLSRYYFPELTHFSLKPPARKCSFIHPHLLHLLGPLKLHLPRCIFYHLSSLASSVQPQLGLACLKHKLTLTMKNVNVNYGHRQLSQLTYSQIKKSFSVLNAQLTSITNIRWKCQLCSVFNYVLNQNSKELLPTLNHCRNYSQVACRLTFYFLLS